MSRLIRVETGVGFVAQTTVSDCLLLGSGEWKVGWCGCTALIVCHGVPKVAAFNNMT